MKYDSKVVANEFISVAFLVGAVMTIRRLHICMYSYNAYNMSNDDVNSMSDFIASDSYPKHKELEKQYNKINDNEVIIKYAPNDLDTSNVIHAIIANIDKLERYVTRKDGANNKTKLNEIISNSSILESDSEGIKDIIDL